MYKPDYMQRLMKWLIDNLPSSNFKTALLRRTAESDNAPYCDRCYCSVFRLSVWPSVTLMHPAKTDGRNETAFGRDTRVVK